MNPNDKVYDDFEHAISGLRSTTDSRMLLVVMLVNCAALARALQATDRWTSKQTVTAFCEALKHAMDPAPTPAVIPPSGILTPPQRLQ